jgi:hypothetical protein
MSEFKNTSSESKIVFGSIVHPGSTVEVDDARDAEVAGIEGFEKTRITPTPESYAPDDVDTDLVVPQ